MVRFLPLGSISGPLESLYRLMLRSLALCWIVSTINFPSITDFDCDLYPAWIFQIAGTFEMAAGTKVILAGGALAKNIVWVVGGGATTTSTAHLEGIVLGKTAITLGTLTSVNGRILAQTMVSLQQATVVVPI